VGLTTSGLSVGETGGHSALEDVPYQGTGCIFVYRSIRAILIEDVIEAETVVFQELGKFHMLSWLVDH